MKNLILLLFIINVSFSFSQAKRIKETLYSETLKRDVEVIIELPKSYEKDTKKKYPFILLLDGEYFMDAFSGNLNFGNYWDLYPECILFGINHLGGQEERNNSFSYNKESGELSEEAIEFYDFLKLELLPNLAKSFRLVNFSIIGGYDNSAGFLNNFLLKEPDLFNGYLVISPEIHASMVEKISNGLKNNPKKNVYYYLSSSKNDEKSILDNTIKINEMLGDKKEFKYNYTVFEDYSHYAAISAAIPSSLNFIFSVFKPIDQYEYDKQIKNLTDKQTQYLIDKYATVLNNFGFRQDIRDTDIKIIEDHIIKVQNYNELLVLAELCKKELPKTLLEKYFIGLYHEHRNEMMLSLKNYKSAFPKEDYGIYNKDLVFEKIENSKN